MLADVVQCLTRAPKTISVLVKDIEYTSGGATDWPAEEQVIVGVSAAFTVRYRLVAGNPYQAPGINYPSSPGSAGAGEAIEGSIEP
jgi:hypothetical protein